MVAPFSRTPSRYHWLPVALLEVSVLLPAVQNCTEPLGVIVGVAGIVLTVTVVIVEAALVQAFPPVTFTV